jgi:hypothetical protein
MTGNGAVYPASFNVPADNDKRNVASVNPSFEALADRTEFLRTTYLPLSGGTMAPGAAITSPNPATPVQLAGLWRGTLIPAGYTLLSAISQLLTAINGGRFRLPSQTGSLTITLDEGIASGHVPTIGAQVHISAVLPPTASDGWEIIQEDTTPLVQLVGAPVGQYSNSLLGVAVLEFGTSGWKVVDANTIMATFSGTNYVFGAVPYPGGL